MPQVDPPDVPRIVILEDGLGPDIVAAFHPDIGLLLPTPRCTTPGDD